MDLRHLAVILDEGRKAAKDLAGPTDAAVVSALEAMTEAAAMLADANQGGDTVWDVSADFEQIANRYR